MPIAATLAGIGEGVRTGFQDLERFKASQQKLELGEQTMAVNRQQQRQNEISLNMQQLQMKKAQQQEQYDQTPVNFTTRLKSMGLTDTTIKGITKEASDMGLGTPTPTGELMMPNWMLKQYVQDIEGNKQLLLNHVQTEVVTLGTQINEQQKLIDSGELKGKEAEAMTEQIQKWQTQKARAEQLWYSTDKDLQKEAAKQKGAERVAEIRAGGEKGQPSEYKDFRDEWKKKHGGDVTGASAAYEAMKGAQQVKTSAEKEEVKSNVKFNDREESFINLQANMLAEDRTTPKLVQNALSGGFGSGQKRMAMSQEIWNRLNTMRPDYNPQNAEINFKAYSSSFAIQRVQLAKTVRPIADKVMKLADKIPQDFDTVPLNQQARQIRRLLGNEDLAAFEFDKNKLVEEFERMLTGAQMADSRVQRNLDLIRSGYSPRVIKNLVQETLDIVGASEEAATSPMRSTGTPIKGKSKTTIRYDSQGNRVE